MDAERNRPVNHHEVHLRARIELHSVHQVKRTFFVITNDDSLAANALGKLQPFIVFRVALRVSGFSQRDGHVVFRLDRIGNLLDAPELLVSLNRCWQEVRVFKSIALPDRVIHAPKTYRWLHDAPESFFRVAVVLELPALPDEPNVRGPASLGSRKTGHEVE